MELFYSYSKQHRFRFLGFALLPLALAILKKYEGLSGVLIASLASAVFILWDIETGLACSSALLFFIFVSEIANRRTVLEAFWLTSLTFTASVFLVASIFMSVLGEDGKPSLLLFTWLALLAADTTAISLINTLHLLWSCLVRVVSCYLLLLQSA